MARITGTTNAQSAFLRAFRTSPNGPAPKDWPSPAILRRWLRRPAFRSALASVHQILRFQTDFQINASAARAATNLDGNPDSPKQLADLLRLAHLRSRFTHEHKDSLLAPPPTRPPKPPPPKLRELTDAEFHEQAWRRGYQPPLRCYPDFPHPDDADLPFLRNLIQHPYALLRYLQLYDRLGNDHRFSPILGSCKRLLDDDSADQPLPNFKPSSRAANSA